MRNSEARRAEGAGAGRESARPTGERRIANDNGAAEPAFSDLMNSWFEEGERLSAIVPARRTDD
jgi:hypothetical protein